MVVCGLTPDLTMGDSIISLLLAVLQCARRKVPKSLPVHSTTGAGRDGETNVGSDIGAGYDNQRVSFEIQREALNDEISRVGYNLVFGELRGNALILRTPMADKLSRDEWFRVAKSASNALYNSSDPRVRLFFEQHLQQAAIGHIVIAKSV